MHISGLLNREFESRPLEPKEYFDLRDQVQQLLPSGAVAFHLPVSALALHQAQLDQLCIWGTDMVDASRDWVVIPNHFQVPCIQSRPQQPILRC